LHGVPGYESSHMHRVEYGKWPRSCTISPFYKLDILSPYPSRIGFLSLDQRGASNRSVTTPRLIVTGVQGLMPTNSTFPRLILEVTDFGWRNRRRRVQPAFARDEYARVAKQTVAFSSGAQQAVVKMMGEEKHQIYDRTDRHRTPYCNAPIPAFPSRCAVEAGPRSPDEASGWWGIPLAEPLPPTLYE
jgi:hypothetical protein